MTDGRHVVAWDTCILLDYIERSHPRVDRSTVECLDRLVAHALAFDAPILIPAYVLVELAWPAGGSTERLGALPTELLALRKAVAQPQFVVGALDRMCAQSAQQMVLDGLSPADATIAGTCVRYRADVLLTRDGMRRRKKRSKLLAHDARHGSPVLRILPPLEWEAHIGGHDALVDDSAQPSSED